MKAKFLLVIAGILFSLPASQSALAQQRGAIWVHGLNETSSEWSRWAYQFNIERHLFFRNTLTNGSNWTTYHSEDGAVAMANNVRVGPFGYNGTADSQSIYFGYSIGGDVGRDIDINHTGEFGGIITTGSPLDGSHLANTSRTGEATWAILDGIGRVSAGPTREFGFAGFIIAGAAVDAVAALLFDILDVFGLRDYGHLGATDMQEGSAYLTPQIRNTQTQTPKIHIYGNEEGPTVWRPVSQAIGNGNDEQYVSLVGLAGDVYEASMWLNYGVAFANLILLDFYGAAYFTFIAEGWGEGMNWWRYDSERGWNHLLGADIPATRTIAYNSFDYQGFNDCMVIAGADWTEEEYTRCREQNTTTQYYTYYAPQNGQSDAFIKATSQVGYQSAWSNNATVVEAQGVNHLEMRKHPRMGDIYDEAFDGAHGSFFFTTR